MKCRKLIFSLMVGFSVFAVGSVVGLTSTNSVYEVHAEGELEDNLNNNTGNTGNVNPGSSDNNEVADFLKGYDPMTADQLNEANQMLSPLTNIIGKGIGLCVGLTSALLFLVTALDLLYITVPFTRKILYSGGGNQMQGGMMGGGYGRMGMGMQQQSGGHGIQLISDEAVQCGALLGSGQQQQMMGGGMGMGMQQSSGMPTKSVIFTYFKKRVVFIVLFAVCTVTLTSSLFLGTGINLAMWLSKIVEAFNNYIPV